MTRCYLLLDRIKLFLAELILLTRLFRIDIYRIKHLILLYVRDLGRKSVLRIHRYRPVIICRIRVYAAHIAVILDDIRPLLRILPVGIELFSKLTLAHIREGRHSLNIVGHHLALHSLQLRFARVLLVGDPLVFAHISKRSLIADLVILSDRSAETCKHISARALLAQLIENLRCVV